MSPIFVYEYRDNAHGRAEHRTENEDPRVTKSRTDIPEPNLVMPYIDMEDPRRAKDRIDIMEPQKWASRMDNDDANRTNP
jgi:hypothetical protein